MLKYPKWKSSVKKSILTIAILLVVAPLIGAGLVKSFPDVGALGAEKLRELAGDQAVAQLEGFIFKLQDGAGQPGVPPGAAQGQLALAGEHTRQRTGADAGRRQSR